MTSIDDLERQARGIHARRRDLQKLLSRHHTEMARLHDVHGHKGIWQRHRLQTDIDAVKAAAEALGRDLMAIEQRLAALRAAAERRIAA